VPAYALRLKRKKFRHGFSRNEKKKKKKSKQQRNASIVRVTWIHRGAFTERVNIVIGMFMHDARPIATEKTERVSFYRTKTGDRRNCGR
jgi:hypothetical protein